MLPAVTAKATAMNPPTPSNMAGTVRTRAVSDLHGRPAVLCDDVVMMNVSNVQECDVKNRRRLPGRGPQRGYYESRSHLAIGV